MKQLMLGLMLLIAAAAVTGCEDKEVQPVPPTRPDQPDSN